MRSNDGEAIRVFNESFTDLVFEGTPRRVFHVLREGDGYSIRLGAVSFGRLPTLGEAVGIVLGQVNRQAVQVASRDRVVFHAACAARDGVGVILAGPMESGKTTTVAGLLGAGFAYLTDEAVALDPASLLLHAYPKPLSIDPGSWETLAHLAPKDPNLFRMQWQVPGSRAGTAGCVDATPAGVVVFLRYGKEGPTRITRVGRAEVMVGLAKLAFHLRDHPRRCLEATAAMLRGCDTYRLEIGSLDQAVQAISEAVDRRSTRP